MKRFLVHGVLALLVLGLGACGGGDDDSGDASGDGGSSANVITIEGSAFSGVESVPDGASVTVKNEDDFQHTFTPDTDGDFEPASLDGGASATVELPGPGTYGYHCSIHTTMTGTITVEG